MYTLYPWWIAATRLLLSEIRASPRLVPASPRPPNRMLGLPNKKIVFREKNFWWGFCRSEIFFLAKSSCGAKTKTSVDIQTAVRSDRVLLMCLQNPKESRLISVYFIIRSTGLQNRCAYKDELLLPESKQESSIEDLEEHRTAIQLSMT